MLKVHVVRGDGYRYYVDDLVPGRAEGGLVTGESPGIWSGRGAGALDLDGRVEASDFRDVLEGLDPRSGTALRQRHARRSVAGYDLTFCAPKSVSLLHLLAPAEIAAEVGAGHRVAVDEAIGYLGRAAVGVRRSRGGSVTLLPSTGAVAGQFLHRTSRALDPHLHTHVVMANVAQGVDGAWSTLDSRRLFVHAPAAQGVYHARLRLELSDRLGAAWEVSPSGLGDVVGVDASMRRLFSTRTASMDEYDHDRPGRAGTAGRTRGAFHATRPHKDRHRTVESLTGEWRERATDFGYDLGDLTRTVGLGRRSGASASAHGFDPGRLRMHLQALADRRGTLFPHDLVAMVATSATRGAPAADIEATAARIGEASVRAHQMNRSGGAGFNDHEQRYLSFGGPRWRAAEVVRAVECDIGRLLDGTPVVRPPQVGLEGRDGAGERGLAVPARLPADRTVELPERGRTRWLGR